MNKLWAPWRMDYIRTPKEDGCIFCTKHKSKKDKENLLLFRGKESFVLMNFNFLIISLEIDIMSFHPLASRLFID